MRGAAPVAAAIMLLLVTTWTPAVAGVTLVFGGDTSHGESYQHAYTDGGLGVLKRGYDAAFDQLKPLLADADLVVLNLETPLTTCRVPPFPEKKSHLWSSPVDAPASLHRLGVDAVSLANNHALDFGPAGLEETRRALAGASIDCFGAGPNLSAAEAPLVRVFQDHGEPIAVAIIGAFEHRDWYEPYKFYARGDEAGVNVIAPSRLAQQIAELKRRRPAPLVIVTPHWGENYVWRSDTLRESATQIIAAGADLVIGHGAHHLQEIERIQGRWVFYSIGNFVFNAEGKYARRGSPPYSLPLRLEISRVGDAYQIEIKGYPIQCDNLATDYQPRPVTGSEMEQVRDALLSRDPDCVLARAAKWSSDERGPYVAVSDRIPIGVTGLDQHVPSPVVP